MPPEPPPPPEPTPRALSAIEGRLEGWTLGRAFITLTGGYEVQSDGQTTTLTIMEPTYTGDIAADGTFSVDLSGPVAEEQLLALGCTADAPDVAVLLIGLVSQTNPIASFDDIVADVTLRPEPEPFPTAMWLYTEDDYRYSGTCDSGENLLSLTEADLELATGWNAVIIERLTFGARLRSADIPESYRWQPAY